MSKEVQMTFRVEPDLRSDFSEAVALADRPAAQVLREFMRAYVSESLQRDNATIDDPFSLAERRRRKAAVDFARASVGLEGFKPSKAAEADALRFIAGGIQLAEFVQVKPDAKQAHER